MSTVREATEESLQAASHLGAEDAGAVSALLVLADKVDQLGESFDNVTLPTYLKYCESLGLTPAGRARLTEKKTEAPSGKLSGLRSVPKPA